MRACAVVLVVIAVVIAACGSQTEAPDASRARRVTTRMLAANADSYRGKNVTLTGLVVTEWRGPEPEGLILSANWMPVTVVLAEPVGAEQGECLEVYGIAEILPHADKPIVRAYRVYRSVGGCVGF